MLASIVMVVETVFVPGLLPKGKHIYIYIVGNVGNSPSAFPHPPRHDLGSWMHLERRVDTCCSKLELGYYQLPRCTFYAV